MRLEQTIRSTMTEAMDMDGRLDQLVRAGLMPTSSLPLLKRAISRMHAGMSLQGAERDVMNMFISSMMFIVLGDDTVFNKARAGAKGYAAEEVDMGQAERGMRSSSRHTGGYHVVDKAGKVVSKHANQGAAMRAALENDDHRVKAIKEAKEKTEYDYEGDMAMSQLKSIIANSQRMHDMLSDDTNLPEWVQSKITLAEDYISTASNYMQGEMNESKDGMPFEGPYRKVGERKDKYGNTIKNAAKHLAKKAMNAQTQKNEEVESIDELSKATMGRYIKKAATKIGTQGVTAGLKIAKDERSQKNFDTIGKRERGISTAVKKLTKEDAEQVDEISKGAALNYLAANKKDDAKARETGDYDKMTKRMRGTDMAVRKYTAKPGSKYVRVPATEDIDAVKQMNESYKTAFETALNEYGIKSPSELDESKRKEFFNYVDLEFKKGDN